MTHRLSGHQEGREVRYLLRGQTGPGMFPNERAVTVKNYEGQDVSLLVNESAVVRRDGEELLQVTLVERRDNTALVLLPGEVFGSGAYISVKSEQLVSDNR